jgi:hypothetical protein
MDLHLVHYTYYRGINRDESFLQGQGGLTTTNEINKVTHTGLHRVASDFGTARGLEVFVDRLHEQKLLAFETGDLRAGDHCAYDFSKIHSLAA